MARLLSHSCTVMFGISSGIYKIHHLRIVLVLSSVLALTAKSSCFFVVRSLRCGNQARGHREL